MGFVRQGRKKTMRIVTLYAFDTSHHRCFSTKNGNSNRMTNPLDHEFLRVCVVQSIVVEGTAGRVPFQKIFGCVMNQVKSITIDCF